MPGFQIYKIFLRSFMVMGSVASASQSASKTVSLNQINLAAGLAAAQPGDTLILSPGGYGVITLPKKSWQTPISIDARSALMTGLVMRNVAGVKWTGGTIIGSMYGVTIRDSSHVTISGVDISIAQRGIVIDSSTDMVISKNTLHHLRTDGIDVVGQRIAIEGNVIKDMTPIQGDHPDGVQIWSPDGYQTRDITVRGNTIIGNMQGIFARAPAMGLINLIVTGNRVTVSYPNGIAMIDTYDSVATGNIVRSPPGATNNANMYSVGARNMVCSNTVPDVPKAPAGRPCISD